MNVQTVDADLLALCAEFMSIDAIFWRHDDTLDGLPTMRWRIWLRNGTLWFHASRQSRPRRIKDEKRKPK
jgi:hypothetical protein